MSRIAFLEDRSNEGCQPDRRKYTFIKTEGKKQRQRITEFINTVDKNDAGTPSGPPDVLALSLFIARRISKLEKKTLPSLLDGFLGQSEHGK